MNVYQSQPNRLLRYFVFRIDLIQAEAHRAHAQARQAAWVASQAALTQRLGEVNPENLLALFGEQEKG